MKRLFVAVKVTLDEEVQQTIASLHHAMRHHTITWVKQDVCHLTLRFIGATPESRIPQIRKALQRVCDQNQPFTMSLNKHGAFGSHYEPRVLWLGFEEFGPFEKMVCEMEPLLQEAGVEPYYGNIVPHITLGRVKKVVDKRRFWEQYEQTMGHLHQEIPIREVTLYQSILHEEGPEYIPVGSFALKAK